jgi:hypothetical protein
MSAAEHMDRPHFLILDPTLILTARGRGWCSRVAKNVTAPAAVLQSRNDGIHLYRWRWPFGGGFDDWPPLPDHVIPIRSAGAPDVVADLWHGMKCGGLLVARRPVTFDELVERGCTVEQSASWVDAAKVATEHLVGAEASAALWRRIRFAAVHDPDRGLIRIADAGRGSYR